MALELPNYRIVEKLGVGAQSRLYRARCMRSGKDYTVKYVVVQKPEDMSIVAQLRTEYEIGSRVDHPAVRKVYEMRMLRRKLRVRGAILFMEYVNGVPLSDRDARPVDEILDLFIKTAHGLHAMHLAGFVHADLKPTNILVTPDREVKLIDLGQSAPRHAAKPRIQGTIHYMAPEQVERGRLDERTDVFGLGATLHRVLTGIPVATGMNRTVNMHSQSLIGKRVTYDNPAERLPVPLARLIAASCADDPLDRPADMPALITRLQVARTVIANRGVNGDVVDDDRLADWDDVLPEEDSVDIDPDGLDGLVSDELGKPPVDDLLD